MYRSKSCFARKSSFVSTKRNLSVWTHKRCRYWVIEHSQRKYDEIFNSGEWGEPLAFVNPYSSRRIFRLRCSRASSVPSWPPWYTYAIDRIKQLTVSPPGVNVIPYATTALAHWARRKGSSRISLVCFANKGSKRIPSGRGERKESLCFWKEPHATPNQLWSHWH